MNAPRERLRVWFGSGDVEDGIDARWQVRLEGKALARLLKEAGCDIIDFAIASMADLTSQPSLNAFCAAMAGDARDPGIDYMSLEPLDIYWMQARFFSRNHTHRAPRPRP